jgi:membrane-associated phospholipid phosphatase
VGCGLLPWPESWPRPSSPGGFFGGGARSPRPYWAPAATLAAERLLKLLVARRAPGSLVFRYPSGHVAVATALVLSLVLILRPAMARPRVKLSIGLSRS